MRFIIFLILYSCNMSEFIDKVLNDFNRNSCFVVIKIVSKDYNGLTAIENDELFYFLSKTKNYKKEEYQSKIKKVLLSKSTIDLENESLEKWNFIKIIPCESINLIADKGIKIFLDHFFEHGVLKGGINENEKAAIIEKLFNWKIPVITDDESGMLVILK